MPGSADWICLTGAASPTAEACNAACTRQMSSALANHSRPSLDAGVWVRIGSGS